MFRVAQSALLQRARAGRPSQEGLCLRRGTERVTDRLSRCAMPLSRNVDRGGVIKMTVQFAVLLSIRWRLELSFSLTLLRFKRIYRRILLSRGQCG